MAIFFTFPKGGVTIIRNTCIDYCEENNLNYVNFNDENFNEDLLDADCVQIENYGQYLFLPNIPKSVAILRDPRDILVSAYHYFKNLPSNENLNFYSQLYTKLTVRQCILENKDDYIFWYHQYKYYFAEMYNLLMSADKNLICIRFENLCEKNTYKETWHNIENWIELPKFKIYGIMNSPCDDRFIANSHVRSAKSQQWLDHIPVDQLEKIEHKLERLLNILDQHCPIVK